VIFDESHINNHTRIQSGRGVIYYPKCSEGILAAIKASQIMKHQAVEDVIYDCQFDKDGITILTTSPIGETVRPNLFPFSAASFEQSGSPDNSRPEKKFYRRESCGHSSSSFSSSLSSPSMSSLQSSSFSPSTFALRSSSFDAFL
jgi:hypothetical protein